MNGSRPKIVDGAEAVADGLYRFSDRLWIDPSLPRESFSDVIASWISAKKRNLWDRVPTIIGNGGDLAEAAVSANGFLADPANLPRVLEALAGSARRRTSGVVVHVAGAQFPLDDSFEPPVLVSGSLQEAADFAVLAHLEVLARPRSFLHVFDGNRLTREMEKIGLIPDEGLKLLAETRTRDFSELRRHFSETSGRAVEPLSYVGPPEADKVIVAMGHAASPIEEAVRSQGEDTKVGFLRIRLLSPFDSKPFVQKIPGTVRNVFALEHPALYLKVLDSLHEGMVNRWSWFAALPRLAKFKSPEQALGLTGLSLNEDPDCVRVLWKELPGDGSLGLIRELANVLAASVEVQACLLPDDGAKAELHLKASRTPFLSNETILKPDIVLSASGGPSNAPPAAADSEVQQPTVAATSLLRSLLAASEQKGLAIDPQTCIQRWRETLEDYYRPLGTNFVRANISAAEAILNGNGNGLKPGPKPGPKPGTKIDPAPRTPNSEQTIRPLTLDVSSSRATLLTSFNDRLPNHDGAFVLPLIREQTLQLALLETYRKQMSRLSFQKARRPFGDRPSGLLPILDRIQAWKASARRPLIARLSALSLDSWAGLAADLQNAGAGAVEIVFESGQDRRSVVRRLKGALTIPVLVSFESRQTDLENAAHDLKNAGADGFVLFQEMPQRDFDVKSKTWAEVAIPPDARHRLEVLEALARLRPRTDLPLVAHGGFSTEEDVAKALALGAQWVQAA